MPGPWKSAGRALASVSIGVCFACPAMASVVSEGATADVSADADATDDFYDPLVVQEIRLDIAPSFLLWVPKFNFTFMPPDMHCVSLIKPLRHARHKLLICIP